MIELDGMLAESGCRAVQVSAHSQLRQQILPLTLDKTVCLRLQFPSCERGLNIFLLQRSVLKGVFIHGRGTVTQGGVYRSLIVAPAPRQGGRAGYEQSAWEGGSTCQNWLLLYSVSEIHHLYGHTILFFLFCFIFFSCI